MLDLQDKPIAPVRTKAPNNNWWRGGVIYQIYPRSFADSNGDGCGDICGITAKLDYVASLGADAIWLSPVFKSPMKDFGYDVSDYCEIDPLFGSLDDFRAMVKRAHQLGLKVIIDQVLSHTSDQHPWFTESRKSKTNSKSDWYVWADPKNDGNPPNNWLSIFGGSAWQWDTRRCQYYLHNFLTSQPDLNFHNPQVQDALLATVKFWLELGVDGFRLDTANFYFHDPELRSNPGRDQVVPNGSAPDVNPYMRQQHVYDKSRPENIGFLKRLRALVDQYPNTTMVGEIGCDDSLGRIAEYTQGGDRLHMAYSFDLLGTNYNARYLHRTFSEFGRRVGDGWPSWAIANHDVVRVATRWTHDPAFLRLAAALQMTARGTPCIYQGDELGLPEADVQFEDLQDPYGMTMWPEFKGRDGCRTPFPWVGRANDMGFGSGSVKPWLPYAGSHRALAVDAQEKDPTALLHYYRALLQWRKTHLAIISGEMVCLEPTNEVFAFVRTYGATSLMLAFNVSERETTYTLPESLRVRGIDVSAPLRGATLSGNALNFAPYGAACVVLGS
jgi:alpha-glucosidase